MAKRFICVLFRCQAARKGKCRIVAPAWRGLKRVSPRRGRIVALGFSNGMERWKVKRQLLENSVETSNLATDSLLNF
jgi:hypothetical protein